MVAEEPQMTSTSNGWSEWRKWYMGLFEKLIVGFGAVVFSFFWVDRYDLAKEERRSRQEALANRQESLSNSSFAYANGLYDAYHTPCGKAGHARVRYLQDEGYFAFTNAIDAIERESAMFRSPALAAKATQSAGIMRSKAQHLYDAYVTPVLRCGCDVAADNIDERLGPRKDCSVDPGVLDTKAFDTDYSAFVGERKKLLGWVAQEYQIEASRTMLAFLWELM
jgi:hypothetical protein